MLRCIIDDGSPEGEVTIHIDDKELSLAEFGRMLAVHAGWGMRIAFVPEEFVSENPKIEIRSPSGESADAATGAGRLSPNPGGRSMGVAPGRIPMGRAGP